MAKRPRIGGGDADRDRISALPDEIIHNILYRLDAPVQAARTSLLSRRWHHLWQSYPVLEFDHEEMGRSAAGHKKFAEFIAASSRRLYLHDEHPVTLLDSLKLSLAKFPEPCSQYARADLTRLLASALGASPLEIVVRTNWVYKFPAGLLSNCSRTKVLKLQGCDLNGVEPGSVSMQSLQVLTLNEVQITEQFLYAFVGNAPNLESLSLETCTRINRLEISASNFPRLKTLDINQRTNSSCDPNFELQLTAAPFLEQLVLTTWNPCKLRTVSLSSAPNLKWVELASDHCKTPWLDLDDFTAKVPSLQALKIIPVGWLSDHQAEFQITSAPCLKTFCFPSVKGICKLNIASPSAAPNLRVLKLCGFTQSNLDGLIGNLPSLESLCTSRTRSSETGKMRIRSDRLRAFELVDKDPRGPLEELEIDAPGLLRACFCGNRFRFPAKMNIINVSSNCKFVVSGYSVPPTRMCFRPKWFLGLRQSLSALSPFHLDMKLFDINLSQQQQVTLKLSQVGCSSPPLIIQLLQLEFTLPESANIPDDNPPAAIDQQSQTSSLELPDERNCVDFLNGLFWACRPETISKSTF